jgi:hypothetical protein
VPSGSKRQVAASTFIVGILSACGSGAGPIGVGSIAQWEDPSQYSGSTPTAPLPSGASSGSVNASSSGGAGASSGGGAALVDACTGTYACTLAGDVTAYQAVFASSGGQCTVTAEGETGIFNADGTVTIEGQVILRWTGDVSEYTACEVDGTGAATTDCVTCDPVSGGAADDAGAND